MLHIITPVYRFELLSMVHESIPNRNDIRWHLSLAKKRGIPDEKFIKEDKRVILHIIDCSDQDTVSKRNAVFENIKDGYFYMLDDDTIFVEEVYTIYKEHSIKMFKGLILGNQSINDQIRHPSYPLSEDPNKVNVDTGMAIASSDVLEHVKFSWTKPGENFGRDFLFWSKCYAYFGDDNVIYLDRIISKYNYLDSFVKKRIITQIRIEKRIGTIKVFYLNLDIYNRTLAKIYDSFTYTYNSIKSFIARIKK